jgi:hypothetical protein
MADSTKTKNAADFRAEAQSERWLKYGGNVLLTAVVVVVLGVLIIYLAQRHGARRDMTSSGMYSLKPATVKLIENLPQKFKIVGLFTKAKSEQQERKVNDVTDTPEVRYQQVADLLQEYQQKSNGKITVEMIDPVTEPGKVDQLFNEVAAKYSNDVTKYKDVLAAYPKTVEQIGKLASDEIAAVDKLPDAKDAKLRQLKRDVAVTMGLFPQFLEQLKVDVKKQLELKVPDYKGAVDAIKDRLENMNELADAVLKKFKTAKEDPATPKEYKDYIAAAEPRYDALKKTVNDLLDKTKSLGQLKQLDELRQNKSNSIAVMGEQDMKVLPATSIYKTPTARTMDADGKVKPQFAGEQQVSTALVTLSAKDKKKVAFIRAGGPPATLSLPMFNYEGYYSDVADRLREYGIEVLEKDVSGQWQMQAMQMQMQGVPLPPEPGDDQLKDAVWVVIATPQDPRQMMQNPTAGQLGPKVNEHLRAGGSAMILFDPQADKMDFLKEWGIDAKPEYLAVHEKVEPQGARSEDRTDDWQRQQPVFVVNEYGDHMITKPLRSLDTLLVPLVPINTVDAKGVKVTKILPVPTNPPAWGERDFDSLRQGKLVKFDPKPAEGATEADLPPPLWGGAVAEKEGGKGRLVVIGCHTFATNDYVNEPDTEVLRTQRRIVPRFPGSAELFLNSVFWLSKLDTMIAISPTALEVPRVAAISDGVRDFWRWGVLTFGLPALVLVAGAGVYLKRRD